MYGSLSLAEFCRARGAGIDPICEYLHTEFFPASVVSSRHTINVLGPLGAVGRCDSLSSKAFGLGSRGRTDVMDHSTLLSNGVT